jgi:sugar phosphate isomerase/epimerase
MGKTNFCFIVILAALSMCSMVSNAQKIGLQLYSLRKQFKSDIEQTLQFINSNNIQYIEGGDTYGMPLPEFLALLKKYSLQAASVGASFEDLDRDPEKVLALARAYGAEFIMCAWIPHRQNQFGLAEIEKAARVFNKAGALFEKAGLELVYHPHGYEFKPYRSGTLFDELLSRAEHFRFEMDVYWVQHAGQDPLELLNTYPQMFPLLHLKDMQRGYKGDSSGQADVNTNVVLGEGQIDIAALVKRAGELGIPYIFLEDESDSVLEQLPKSLAYLRQLRSAKD